MEESFNKSNQPKYFTVADFCKVHPWPPVGGLRHLIFHAETNGFKKVIRRVGRKILINEKAFYDWVEEINANNRQPITSHDNTKMA